MSMWAATVVSRDFVGPNANGQQNPCSNNIFGTFWDWGLRLIATLLHVTSCNYAADCGNFAPAKGSDRSPARGPTGDGTHKGSCAPKIGGFVEETQAVFLVPLGLWFVLRTGSHGQVFSPIPLKWKSCYPSRSAKRGRAQASADCVPARALSDLVAVV